MIISKLIQVYICLKLKFKTYTRISKRIHTRSRISIHKVQQSLHNNIRTSICARVLIIRRRTTVSANATMNSRISISRSLITSRRISISAVVKKKVYIYV